MAFLNRLKLWAMQKKQKVQQQQQQVTAAQAASEGNCAAAVEEIPLECPQPYCRRQFRTGGYYSESFLNHEHATTDCTVCPGCGLVLGFEIKSGRAWRMPLATFKIVMNGPLMPRIEAEQRFARLNKWRVETH